MNDFIRNWGLWRVLVDIRPDDLDASSVLLLVIACRFQGDIQTNPLPNSEWLTDVVKSITKAVGIPKRCPPYISTSTDRSSSFFEPHSFSCIHALAAVQRMVSFQLPSQNASLR